MPHATQTAIDHAREVISGGGDGDAAAGQQQGPAARHSAGEVGSDKGSKRTSVEGSAPRGVLPGQARQATGSAEGLHKVREGAAAMPAPPLPPAPPPPVPAPPSGTPPPVVGTATGTAATPGGAVQVGAGDGAGAGTPPRSVRRMMPFHNMAPEGAAAAAVASSAAATGAGAPPSPQVVIQGQGQLPHSSPLPGSARRVLAHQPTPSPRASPSIVGMTGPGAYNLVQAPASPTRHLMTTTVVEEEDEAAAVAGEAGDVVAPLDLLEPGGERSSRPSAGRDRPSLQHYGSSFDSARTSRTSRTSASSLVKGFISEQDKHGPGEGAAGGGNGNGPKGLRSAASMLRNNNSFAVRNHSVVSRFSGHGGGVGGHRGSGDGTGPGDRQPGLGGAEGEGEEQPKQAPNAGPIIKILFSYLQVGR